MALSKDVGHADDSSPKGPSPSTQIIGLQDYHKDCNFRVFVP